MPIDNEQQRRRRNLSKGTHSGRIFGKKSANDLQICSSMSSVKPADPLAEVLVPLSQPPEPLCDAIQEGNPAPEPQKPNITDNISTQRTDHVPSEESEHSPVVDKFKFSPVKDELFIHQQSDHGLSSSLELFKNNPRDLVVKEQSVCDLPSILPDVGQGKDSFPPNKEVKDLSDPKVPKPKTTGNSNMLPLKVQQSIPEKSENGNDYGKSSGKSKPQTKLTGNPFPLKEKSELFQAIKTEEDITALTGVPTKEENEESQEPSQISKFSALPESSHVTGATSHLLNPPKENSEAKRGLVVQIQNPTHPCSQRPQGGFANPQQQIA